MDLLICSCLVSIFGSFAAFFGFGLWQSKLLNEFSESQQLQSYQKPEIRKIDPGNLWGENEQIH